MLRRPLNFPVPQICGPCDSGKKIPGNCVIYTGAETTNLHITTDMTLNEIINIIDESISTILNHTHSVADADGTLQFNFAVGEKIRFEGLEGIGLTFDSPTKKVVISGDPNWDIAADKYPVEVEVTGATEDKTLVITLNDGTTLETQFDTGSDSAGFTRLVRFKVGDVDFPEAGDTTYSHPALDGKTEEQVMLFVDGLEVYAGLADEFSFSLTGDTITFNAPLKDQSKIKIYSTNLEPTTTSTTTTTTTAPPTTTTTTTTTLAPGDSIIYYGSKSTAGAPNESEILLGDTIIQDLSDPLVVDWSGFSGPQYLWFATPDPDNRVQWYEHVLNFGPIGGTTDVFGPHTLVTVSGTLYRVWITQFETEFGAITLS